MIFKNFLTCSSKSKRMIKNKLSSGTKLTRADMQNIKGGVAPAGELWACNFNGSTVYVCNPGTRPPACGVCDYVTLCTTTTSCGGV